MFERDNVPGGNWHYSSEAPVNAPIPNIDPYAADFQPHFPPKDVELPYEMEFDGLDPEAVTEMKKQHRAPKPIWHSLTATGPKVCFTI